MPWVDNRENELLGVMVALRSLVTDSTITTLDRNPVGKITQGDMDAVLLFEGPDYVDKQSGTSTKGAQQRTLSFVLELWIYDEDISTQNETLRSLYNNVRSKVLSNKNIYEKNLTRVFTGPVPGILGVGIWMELKYLNNGN